MGRQSELWIEITNRDRVYKEQAGDECEAAPGTIRQCAKKDLFPYKEVKTVIFDANRII